jgi:hypothetical protein
LKVVDSTETRVCSSVFMATARLPSQSRKRNRYRADGIFKRDSPTTTACGRKSISRAAVYGILPHT